VVLVVRSIVGLFEEHVIIVDSYFHIVVDLIRETVVSYVQSQHGFSCKVLGHA
jgi:hypothetical protein